MAFFFLQIDIFTIIKEMASVFIYLQETNHTKLILPMFTTKISVKANLVLHYFSFLSSVQVGKSYYVFAKKSNALHRG